MLTTVAIITAVAIITTMANIDKTIRAMNFFFIFDFIFKKTIPFFWIPAHTITFLLPAEFQVLFAAMLSVVLGLILAVATLKSEK